MDSRGLEEGKTLVPSFIQAKINRCWQDITNFQFEGVIVSFEEGRLNRIREGSYSAQAQGLIEEYNILLDLTDPDSDLLQCLIPNFDESLLLVHANTLPELSDQEKFDFDDLYLSAQRVRRALDFPRDQLQDLSSSDIASIPTPYDQAEAVINLIQQESVSTSPFMLCMQIALPEVFVLDKARKSQLQAQFGEEKIFNRVVQDAIRVQRGLRWPNQSSN